MSPVLPYGAFLKDFYPRFNGNRYDRILQHFEIDSRKKLKKNVCRSEAEGGNRRRILSQGHICCCWMSRFPIWMFFSKQDSVKMLLSLLNDEETVLISSHDIDDIDQVIDRAVVLRQGRIVQDVVMRNFMSGESP